MLRAGGFALFQNVALYVILTFVPSFQSETLGYSALTASVSSVISMSVTAALIPVFGLWSDHIGRRFVLGAACVLAVVCSYPLFALMGLGSTSMAVVAHVGLGVILAVFLGPTLAAMNELFTTRVRYGGFSLGYNLSVSLFGGTAPFVITLLVSRTGNIAAPAFCIGAAAVVTLLVVLGTRESAPARSSAG